MIRRSIHPRTRRPLLALLAVALLLRALVPAGYMLAADQLDGLIITICHGAGIAPSHLPMQSGDFRDSDSGSDSGSCAFALSAAGAPLPGFPQGFATSWRQFPAVVRDGEPRLHVPSISRAQSPRAPPARA